MTNLNINTTKNLLAFSGGIDSTALFFLLLEQNIPFDIAIVNYNFRVQSKEEVAYAHSLAQQYNKRIFLKEVTLESSSNFEKNARDIRYKFFEEIIHEHSYETLLTAHQLNDKLEWFLMQFSKGAGLSEILGFKEQEERDTFTLLRPLIHTTKDELKAYLDKKSIHYFIDESNQDTHYTRNKIRAEFSNTFLSQYQKGVTDSFSYLEKDLDSLSIDTEPLFKKESLEIFKASNDDNINIRIIDQRLKHLGFIISTSTREEILLKKEVVVSHTIAVTIKEKTMWISPYLVEPMDKKFKEKCRIKKIPKHSRGYIKSIYKSPEALEALPSY